MTQSSTSLHESKEDLPAETIDRHRAIVSLMEELEAVDWYDQRVHACRDSDLRAILEHNRDEEKEHAAMVLEWLRRTDGGFEEQLREYLFASGPIVERENEITESAGAAEEPAGGGRDGSLGIGSLKAVQAGGAS